jgi:CubicO group peptidase (beta-lactamase class C family)
MLVNQTFLSFYFSIHLILAGIPTSVLQGGSGEIQSYPVDSFSLIDGIVEKAIVEHNIPGAVVLVGHQGKIIFEKAYGNRSLEPLIEPMTVDTIFDLASLTKVIATTPAAMILLQQGKLKLDDSVAKYIPAFARRGKGKITIRHLLIHYSGLPADLRLPKKRKISAKRALTQINQIKAVACLGEQFIYSDLGFIVLGKVIERASGMNLDMFTQQNIFSPLMMKSTRFRPSPHDRALIAPTERGKGGEVMRGQVHDPLAATLGGVAGHAGLFSTGEDLARFCQMLLNQGKLNGVQILSPDVVREMSSPQSPPLKQNVRGFGWDIQSTYSSVKGSHFSSRSYGHTGYTGTSVWIDPETQSFLIILTNRVHPDGKGNVKELRMGIADIVGATVHPAIEGSPPPRRKVPSGCSQSVSSNQSNN